jgi:regulatory protein
MAAAKWRASGSSVSSDDDLEAQASDTQAGNTQAGNTQAGDPEAKARQICLRLLTVSPRTRAQLAQALSRRGVPDEAAEAVLSRFTDAGLIDDAAFARAWVESRHHSRGLSRRSLSDELKRRGVDNEEIREAVGTLDPEQEAATARHLVERKMASSRGRPPEARVRQAASLLARKGYPAGLSFRLIKEVLEQEGSDDAIGLDLDEEPYLAPEDDVAPGYSQ